MGIPIRETLKLTFNELWCSKTILINTLTIPVTLGIILDVLFLSNNLEGFLYYSYMVLSHAIYIIIAITCHRLILLGKDSIPKYGINRWSSRETWFAIWLILLYAVLPHIFLFKLISTLYMIAIQTSFWVYAILLSCSVTIYFILIIRVDLIFPHIAIDKSKKIDAIKWSIEKTNNNTWRLFVLFILLPLILSSPSYVLQYLIDESQKNQTMNLFYEISSTVISYVATIFFIGNLSVCYKWLSNNN